MRAVVDGGLESVLDEHFWLRAQNLPEGSAGLAADLEQSIGLRAGGFSLHTLARNPEKIPVRCHVAVTFGDAERTEEHTSELQSLMRNSYAVYCLKKKKKHTYKHMTTR